MSLCRLSALVVIASCWLAAEAHHSFAVVFDGEQPLTLTGTVTTVEWTNPHMHFSIEVRNEDGTVSEWRFEGYPPNMLVRQGWQRNVTMNPGDRVTVTGWQARSQAHLAAARHVTFEDGRQLTAGPPAGTGGR